MRGCELHSRQRHVLPHILGVKYEALLELHALLLMLLLHILVVMMLLLLGRMSLLHLLLLLLFLSLLLLLCGSMSLRKLFRCWLLCPAPFFFELLVNEADAPSRLFVDFLENSNDFFLLVSVGDDFACMCERTNGYGGNAAADMVSRLFRPVRKCCAYRSLT